MHNAAKMIQNIFEDGAAGDQDAYGPGLRALTTMHEVMQPAKDEQKGYGLGGMIAPRFTRPPPTPSAAEGPSGELPAIVDAEGNPYVDGDA